MYIRHRLDYQLLPTDKEKVTGESMTIPDETLSIQQIMLNHTRGLGIPQEKAPIYDDEEFLPHPKTLDFVDIQEMGEENLETFDKYKREDKKRRDNKLVQESRRKFHVEQEERLKKTQQTTQITLPEKK